jgi:hypothetical protein
LLVANVQGLLEGNWAIARDEIQVFRWRKKREERGRSASEGVRPIFHFVLATSAAGTGAQPSLRLDGCFPQHFGEPI